MASVTCSRRLRKELIDLKKSPVENIIATPNEKNILEWHYVISGPKGTPYEGGVYHGMLKFPSQYPYKPPSIIMCTKNGRFKTDTRLCLSMSDFHPETWNPMWSVSSILSGLLSFMLESSSTLGSIETSERQKRILASRSLQENLKNQTFCKLFPEKAEELREIVKEREELERIRELSSNSNTANDGGNGVTESGKPKQDEVSCFAVTVAFLVACTAIAASFVWV